MWAWTVIPLLSGRRTEFRGAVQRAKSEDRFQGRDACGQASKGVWGMSRRQEAMKGVEDCDKPGGLVKRELIPGSPNYHVLNP